MNLFIINSHFAILNLKIIAVSAVILMSALVYFFITDLYAVAAVVISILSICFGALAYLHLWNVRLDAISLISLLMSIGFSVDYSAHICYHYLAQKVFEFFYPIISHLKFHLLHSHLL